MWFRSNFFKVVAMFLAMTVTLSCGNSKSSSQSESESEEADLKVFYQGGYFERKGPHWIEYSRTDEDDMAEEYEEAEMEDQEGAQDYYLLYGQSQNIAIPKSLEGTILYISPETGDEWLGYAAITKAEKPQKKMSRGLELLRSRAKGLGEETQADDESYAEEGPGEYWNSNKPPVGVMPDEARFYMRSSKSGDEIKIWIRHYNMGEIPQIAINVDNLEGWLFEAAYEEAAIRKDCGDYWAVGGPLTVSWVSGAKVWKPTIMMAKDWSWVRMDHVDDVFDVEIAAETFERDQKSMMEWRVANGLPEAYNPALIYLSNQNRATDQVRENTTRMVKRWVEEAYNSPSSSGSSSGSSSHSSNRRPFVRVKEYHPDYAPQIEERVWCPECRMWDKPHIHYNKYH